MPHVEGATVTLTTSGATATPARSRWSRRHGLGLVPDATASRSARSSRSARRASPRSPSAGARLRHRHEHADAHDGGSWVADGFQLGQQVTIGRLPGTWTVVDVTATVLDAQRPAARVRSRTRPSPSRPSPSTSASSRRSRRRRSRSTWRSTSPTSRAARTSSPPAHGGAGLHARHPGAEPRRQQRAVLRLPAREPVPLQRQRRHRRAPARLEPTRRTRCARSA